MTFFWGVFDTTFFDTKLKLKSVGSFIGWLKYHPEWLCHKHEKFPPRNCHWLYTFIWYNDNSIKSHESILLLYTVYWQYFVLHFILYNTLYLVKRMYKLLNKKCLKCHTLYTDHWLPLQRRWDILTLKNQYPVFHIYFEILYMVLYGFFCMVYGFFHFILFFMVYMVLSSLNLK